MSESRQEIRKDLMRRWFAVAISVGFATTLVHMDWLNAGRVPNYDEWQQLARLAVALTAVILSWEGYFFSIEAKPLTSSSRFTIDFILVLLYTVLLYTSKIPTFWLYIHAISFFFYVIWDLLSIHEYRGTYVYGTQEQASPATWKIYLHGTTGKEGYYRGPVITLSWGLYFVGLVVAQYVLATRNAFLLAPFAFLGLIAYRHDKTLASAAKTGGAAWGTIKRLGLMVVLLGALVGADYLAKAVCR
jgi:hypothetical protein